MKKFITFLLSSFMVCNFVSVPCAFADENTASIQIEDVSYPKWCMAEENGFIFKGKITSEKTISKVYAEVCRRNSSDALLATEISPDAETFDIAALLNSSLKISVLGRGAYTFTLSATDSDGTEVQLVSSDFLKIGSRDDYSKLLIGDINDDGIVNADDAEILNNNILGVSELTDRQFILADLNKDTYIDVFDMIELRSKISENTDNPDIPPDNPDNPDIPPDNPDIPPENPDDDGWFTDEAGQYTTKNVDYSLNIRENPDISAKAVGQLPSGSVFEVLKYNENWAYIKYNDISGYVTLRYIKKYTEGSDSDNDPDVMMTYTTKDVYETLNIRKGAGTGYDIVGTIPAGAKFKASRYSATWAYVYYEGVAGYVYTDYIQLYENPNYTDGGSVMLSVMEYNQHPTYPTGCESAALYILLQYYKVNVTMEEIVTALPKGPLPYSSGGAWYGANPEREFVGDPHSAYSYGVFNIPIAETAEKFLSGVKTKTGATMQEIIELLDNGKPIVAWYTTNPYGSIYYSDHWYDYITGEYISWPAGEHAVVICGYDDDLIIYRDPDTGSSRVMTQSHFLEIFNELGARIVHY